MSYAINVENVTVRFNIANQKIDNIKEYFIKLVKRNLMFQEFFALKNINLAVEKGDSWGILGVNGSGKSTLLKVMSGIIKPYEGKVTTNGLIAPLIELGAGFDQNLSARENIFLNGLLLGHSKKYMEKHFDEIVDFADVWQFIDSPIKNFSSGMNARLGFAIATMVQPEIFIVDEVLSVGDFLFRKKCEERIKKMLGDGTTLIYVSHDIETVKSLCRNAMWLSHGETVMAGAAEEVCAAYAANKASSISSNGSQTIIR